MAFQKNMYDRTLSIYSAGKIFAATGVRSGWVIGNEELIKKLGEECGNMVENEEEYIFKFEYNSAKEEKWKDFLLKK